MSRNTVRAKARIDQLSDELAIGAAIRLRTDADQIRAIVDAVVAYLVEEYPSQDLYIPSAVTYPVDEIRADFKTKFNNEVQVYAPYVYDAVMVMAAAMEKAGSADPAKYLPELAKTDGYKGVTGSIGFDEKGDIKNGALTLYTYKGGKRELLAVVR